MDMYMNAKVNNVKCQKLGRQLHDVTPFLKHLLDALDKKTAAMLAATPPSAEQLAQFKRETESLQSTLQTLHVTAKEVHKTISEWTAKGKRLFGALRQMLQANNYAQVVDISTAMSGLQTALATITFLNVNEVQKQLRELVDGERTKQQMAAAAEEDVKALPGPRVSGGNGTALGRNERADARPVHRAAKVLEAQHRGMMERVETRMHKRILSTRIR